MKRMVVGVLALIGVMGFGHANASAVVPDLGDAATFAVLAMKQGSDAPDLSLTSVSFIIGDVGIGPGTISTNGSYSKSHGASVFGDVHLAPGTDTSGVNGPNTGNFLLNSNLSSAILGALQAASVAEVLGATQTFVGDITGTQTITGSGGINVINAPRIDLSGSQVLTLSGGASDYFIFQLTASSGVSLGLSGSSDIILSGGVSGSHVLYYISQTTSNSDTDFVAETTGASTLKGTILAPFGDIKFHGNLINGALIGNDINFGSGGDISYLGFESTVIPEPSSLLLLGMGLACLGRRIRRMLIV